VARCWTKLHFLPPRPARSPVRAGVLYTRTTRLSSRGAVR
jgi:hypothetical protein